jgi:hypothetical protein
MTTANTTPTVASAVANTVEQAATNVASTVEAKGAAEVASLSSHWNIPVWAVIAILVAGAFLVLHFL